MFFHAPTRNKSSQRDHNKKAKGFFTQLSASNCGLHNFLLWQQLAFRFEPSIQTLHTDVTWGAILLCVWPVWATMRKPIRVTVNGSCTFVFNSVEAHSLAVAPQQLDELCAGVQGELLPLHWRPLHDLTEQEHYQPLRNRLHLAATHGFTAVKFPQNRWKPTVKLSATTTWIQIKRSTLSKHLILF